MTDITIKIGTLEDFKKLCELDYRNTIDKVFSVNYDGSTISLSEIDLPEVKTNPSDGYIKEIKEDIIPILDQANILPLVAFLDGNPAGYILAQWEHWPNGKVLVVRDILVANEYLRKGIAKTLIQEVISRAQTDPNCRGVHTEMDTEKYQANKLFLKSGFLFGGTKFFIYSKELPSKYSKEAVYFYYPI